MMPLVLGLKAVTLPVVPLKAIALFRVKVWLPSAGLRNWLKVPTAYMVPPHGTSWRT